MQFDDALRYLLGLGHETLAIKLGLTNTERLLEALGRPQSFFQIVQIAGTNGKGSTAVMLEAVARAAGIKVGLFTSPHLVSITERIRIDGQEITREEFARLTVHVRSAAERLRESGALPVLPTFFEHVTAIALAAFKEARVELTILETGLGGRLDSTTAARAETVAITPIAFDHQEYLGTTLSDIAAEKAAIIRPGVTAIIAPQPLEAIEVILKRCADSVVTPRIDDCSIEALGAERGGRLRVSFRTQHDRYEKVLLGLRGRHQAINASVALRLAEALRERGFSISRADIIRGLESAEHAGRLELRQGQPAMLFDGAHNAASARALAAYLDEFVKAPVTLLFGAMRDKDLTEMAAALFPLARRVILTEFENPRAASSETLARAAPPGFDPGRITLTSSPGEALRVAREQTPPQGIICVTGSLYLVGEVMKLEDKERGGA
jgi:dihydrofolate synthase / folylpolyglutamate synthase